MGFKCECGKGCCRQGVALLGEQVASLKCLSSKKMIEDNRTREEKSMQKRDGSRLL